MYCYPHFLDITQEKLSNLPKVTQMSDDIRLANSQSLLSTGTGRELPPLARPHLHPKRKLRLMEVTHPSADSLLSSSLSVIYLPYQWRYWGIVLLKLSIR